MIALATMSHADALAGDFPENGYDRILHKALASAAMTREEIEKRMDELAREFAKTHDRQIAEKFFELARRLREMEH